MKKCTKCNLEKSTEEFNKRSASKDGYNSCCKECNKLALKSHYKRNKNKYAERNKKKREELQKAFKTFKESLCCIKCGEDRYWVLDFHHRDPNEKDGYINNLFLNNSKSRLEEELKKCDVLCANCYRDVHHKENI